MNFIELMKLSNEQLHKIIQAVCSCISTIAAIILVSSCTMSMSIQKNNTCISTIAAIILVSSCTMSMSIQKNNTQSNQSSNQSTQVDSTNINLKPLQYGK